MFTLNISIQGFHWAALYLAFVCQVGIPVQQESESMQNPPPLISDRTEDQVERFLANVPSIESHGPKPGLLVWTSSQFKAEDLIVAMLASCVVLCLMAPGTYVFYTSLQGSSINLESLGKGMSLLCFLALAWVLFIYSLAFSRNAHSYDVLDKEIQVTDRETAPGNVFIGELTNSGFGGLESQWGGGIVRHPLRRMGDRIPHSLFMTLQMMIYLQSVVPLLVIAGKGIGSWPSIPFWLMWSACVYAPLCYWIQGGGWLAECLDAGGAIPVHIGIGFTALGLAWINSPSSSLSGSAEQSTGLITGWILWVGGIFFFTACRSAMNHRGWTPDLLNVFMGGCAGQLTWMVFHYKTIGPKINSLWLFGPIAGMIAVSSGSASISPGFAAIVGVFGAVAARVALMARREQSINMLWLLFAIHGVSAFVGLVMTGILASTEIAGNDTAGKPIVGLLGGSLEPLRVQLLTATISAILACFGGIVLLRVAQVVGAILKRLFADSAAGH